MRSHCVAMGLLGTLALVTTTGCTPVEEIPAETATASPSPSPAAPAPTSAVPAPAGDAPFEEPLVSATGPGIKGLAPLVNPVERLKQIRSGRTDPFATTQTVGIRVSVTQPPPSERTAPAPPSPNDRLGTPGTSGPGGTPGTPSTPGTPAPMPPPFPVPGTPASPGGGTGPGGTGTVSTAPPVPQPDLARAVEVTGVVQVGDVPRAIIQAPNEATSRYVMAGQRVANGRVLVKRIDANQFPGPVVVLEENGIEVIKAVGEGATQGDEGATQVERTTG
ncbi:hypothetical protein OOK60_11760 [Trichothermofontia sichuanensis B231]|uniref:hypothetical protein n=1 Tax=Trichothermofontia sichuanensis TaxID=3045816 RepID=UPI0022468CF1|nr:hypothetical protein [Trichothermofontia sichuanensis]UZQ53187.1 hypothetical protein OOK60_11760 [Trichothermofontia sichuanensis B231]